MIYYLERVGFYFNIYLVVIYKSSNIHICPDDLMIIRNIETIVKNIAAIIGGNGLHPKVIGIVLCYWKGDQVQIQTNNF